MKKYQELSMNTLLDFKFKGQNKRMRPVDLYRADDWDGDEELFLAGIQKWITAGKAIMVDERSNENIMRDKIEEELEAIEKAKTIKQDREDRIRYNEDTLGIYPKVGFQAHSLIHAQEMMSNIVRGFNVPASKVEITMKDGKVLVVVKDCPVRTFQKLSRLFTVQKATEMISNTVEKTSKNTLDVVDVAMGSIALPVAKTGIKTVAKLTKTFLSFGAKVGGIAIGETIRAGKDVIEDVRTDGYIAEARGEIVDGVHAVRRVVSKKGGSAYGGVIMDDDDYDYADSGNDMIYGG